jgi:hypothetical protein
VTDASRIDSRTPGGVLIFCEYLTNKGYASAAQVNPWRTAIVKVFETVEGEGWESLDLTSVDLDDYFARFQTLAGAQYKAESITAYKRRIHNAIDAHEHYITAGRPPTFRQAGSKPKSSAATAKPNGSDNVVTIDAKQSTSNEAGKASGLLEFPYPLGDGRMAKLYLPPRVKADDVNRLCAFIRTLQDDSPDQRQIPRKTGEDGRQAA